ncbi:MAG: hypothetical protein ACRDY7_13050 [Acidimicrobiia bacterium]
MRRLAILGAAGVAVAGVLGVTPAPAHALDASFRALAAGDGVRVTFTVPNAPLSDNVADFGGPVAQAVLDSIGESSAYASFPNPGAGPATSPALIRGASGGQAPVPDYPFFVFSKSPGNPKQEFGAGPLLLLRAQSEADSSSALASVGGDAGEAAVGLAKVEAVVESTAEAITSSASSDTTTFAVGPLRIGRVFSTATATFDADGELTRTAETVVEGITVDGTGVESGAADLQALNEALAQEQLTVELLSKRETETGVVAPTVQVTQTDPSSGGTIVYKIGSASAFVDADLLPPSGAGAAGSGAGLSGPAVPAGTSRAGAVAVAEAAPVLRGLAQRGVHGSSPGGSSLGGRGPGPQPLAESNFGLAGPSSVTAGTQPAAAPSRAASPSDSAAPAEEPARPQLALAGAAEDAEVSDSSAARRILVPTSDLEPVFAVLFVAGLLGIAVPGLSRARRVRHAAGGSGQE